MTSETPPSEYFTGINFNSSFYTEEPITEGEGDKRYLIKTQSDSTFAGRQTFNTEIATTNFSWTRGIAVVSSIPEYNPGGAYLTFLLGILAEMDSSGRIYGQALEIVNNAVLNTCTFSGLVTCNAQVNITAGLNTATANSAVFTNSVQASTKLISPLLDGVAPDGSVSIASSQTTGSLIIGNSSTRTGTIYISNASPSAHSIIIGNETANAQTLNIASKTINLGNSTVASTVSTKVPITIGHGISTNLAQLGGTSSVIPPTAVSIGATAVTLISFTNIPIGVYQVYYQIFHTILTSTISFTEQRVLLCDTENAINAPLNRIETLESVSSPGISRPPGNFTITGGGIRVNNVASEVAYLNVKYTFTGTGTLIEFGYIRLVRIG